MPGLTLPKRRISVHLSVVFVLLLAAIGAVLAITQYNTLVDTQVESAEKQYALINEALAAKVSGIFLPAQVAVGLIAQSPVTDVSETGDRLEYRRLLGRFLDENPQFANILIGYLDGDFIIIRRAVDLQEQERFAAPAATAYIVQTIDRTEGAAPRATILFYDDTWQEILRRDDPDYAAYDPRTRPWFTKAQEDSGQVTTEPYVFSGTGEIGMTLAARDGGQAVAAVDITLNDLSDWLSSLKPTDGSEIALVGANGSIIAHTEPSRVVRRGTGESGEIMVSTLMDSENATLRTLARAAGDDYGDMLRYEVNGKDFRGAAMPVEIFNGQRYLLLTSVSEQEFFTPAYVTARNTVLYMLPILLAGILVTVFVARRVARPLRDLSEDVASVRQFDFSQSPVNSTGIIEIDNLADSVARMKETIRKFLDISTAIASEEDLDTLLRRLLDEIIDTTKSEAGVLYLADETGSNLLPQSRRLSGQRDFRVDMSPIPVGKAGNLVLRAIAERRTLTASATDAELAALSLGNCGDVMETPPQALLATPLFNRSGELIGALLLLEADEIDQGFIGFTQALSGSAAISVETRQLIHAQRQLFDNFLQLIAGAIDAKSPYTGGHCRRVPELTKMIASAAERTTDGPFAAFSLSDDEWRAVHVAAWLHDCGKVTSPEFVVDKATKLETIYDRIHEIRMRIEVMKREAEIAYLKSALTDGPSPERKAAMEAELKALDEDFSFIATCNVGGEFMADEAIERLNALARKTWTRTLDNRIGISRDEQQRRDREPPKPLPTLEPLLADGPEHIIERPAAERLAPDNPWGFKVEVPQALYDRGEIHNLSIRRGTLTDEERYKINEHIIQTIKMLESLPLPRHLQSVPELAGGHHEKMDGTGYPKRLTRGEMSPVARMMAIADIFEALTAADRPYKKAKSLSEALRIMSFMANDGHIDPELYDLFLTQNVYREYADRYLPPEQIEDIDIEEYRIR